MLKKITNKNFGFTLIEALTLLFVFSLITLTFYSVMSVGLRYIQDSKNRLAALAVANEKTEIVRNLQYDSIGTVGGTIGGNIPQDQDVTENGKQFHVRTFVEYVDDPYDGLAYADTVWFEDYKKVTIMVSWGSAGNAGEVELVSRFVPPGKEVPNIGDGILSVNIFSDQPDGGGIEGSSVHIYNPETGINTSDDTDAAGNVTFMGDTVTDSIQKYQITVVKDDYETVATMPPYPDSAYDPVDVHASVVTGSMNVKNIVQNPLANIEISTVDYLDQSISSADFHLSGGRKLGAEHEDPFLPVYNLNEDSSTDSGGEKLFSAISPGEYSFSLIGSTFSDYEIINIDPALPFFLLSSDGTLNVKVKLASKTATALMVNVLNNDGDVPILGAIVIATNASGYNQTLTTTSDGKVFFPVSADPFLPETYHIKVTADGFIDSEIDVEVVENELKMKTIKLTEIP